jgi:hypothetical protein
VTICRPQGELDIYDFCGKPAHFSAPLVNIAAFGQVRLDMHLYSVLKKRMERILPRWWSTVVPQ